LLPSKKAHNKILTSQRKSNIRMKKSDRNLLSLPFV
jgi:hypothetical protein